MQNSRAKSGNEMKMRAISLLGGLAFVVLAVSIPILIISGTVNIYAHSADLYKYGFNKYRISAATGISDEQLNGVAQRMADFFNGKLPSPQMTVRVNGLDRLLYSQKELVHLDDVRSIISVFKTLQTAAILAFLVAGASVFAAMGARRLLRGIQVGAVATVFVMGLLVVWALIDFNSLFYLFHIVSFSNDLWLLDPSKDYLIMMFTESFFYDAAIMVIATVIAEAIALGLIMLLIEKTMLARPQ
jgi:integral membrane protein (TIGR01906 family)